MKKHILLPALAWLGGIAGFVLRRWELNMAYDHQTHLMRVTVPGVLLTVLMIALGAAFVVGCCKMGRRAAEDWLYAPSSGYAMVALAGALVMLLAGGFGLRNLYAGEERGAINVLACILLVVGGAMAAVVARELYRGIWSEQATPILLMGLPFAVLVWLVGLYQRFASQPETQLYVWQVLSAVAMLLALYGLASVALNKSSASRTCVCALLTVMMAPVALADGVGLVSGLVWLGGAVWLTAQSYMLLNAAFGPERPQRMCPADDEAHCEEETDLEDTNDE